MSVARIVLLDEVNAVIKDVSGIDMRHVIKKIALMTPNGRHTPAYQIGAWDGKEAQLSEDGTTYFFMLESILPLLEQRGYTFKLVDQRLKHRVSPNPIDDSFLEYCGITLRHYQVSAVNAIIERGKGIIDVATSGGKTLISTALVKSYEAAADLPSITIVPSLQLVRQTYKDYQQAGLDVGRVAGTKWREWDKKHIISTWQTLNRNRDKVPQDFTGIVIYDEVHVMGDTMYSFLSKELRNSYIRVGMTGSVPKNKWKRQKMNCHIGADVVIRVAPNQLQNEGFIATCDIELVAVHHTIDLSPPTEYDWELEFAYMQENPARIAALADYLESLPPAKRLVLTHPVLGKTLATMLGKDFIIDETPDKLRQEYFTKFESVDAYELIASFNTTGTGISIDEITHIVTIDIGKNYTRVVQSIGRGLRLDGEGNHLKVTDIYSRLFRPTARKTEYGFSGGKHLAERKKIYKELKYPVIDGTPIIVE